MSEARITALAAVALTLAVAAFLVAGITLNRALVIPQSPQSMFHPGLEAEMIKGGSYAYLPPYGGTEVITVTGTYTIYVQAKEVQITLTITNPRPAGTANVAYGEVINRANKLVTALKGIAGVTEVRTTSLSLTPQYTWSNGVKEFQGYVASYSLSIRTNLTAAGEVISKAMIIGGDYVRLSSVYLTASPNEIVSARVKALKGAAEDAYMKALSIAKALNTTLGKPLYITTGYYVPRLNEGVYLGTAEKGGAEEPLIEAGGGIPVTATVTATFQIGG